MASVNQLDELKSYSCLENAIKTRHTHTCRNTIGCTLLDAVACSRTEHQQVGRYTASDVSGISLSPVIITTARQ